MEKKRPSEGGGAPKKFKVDDEAAIHITGRLPRLMHHVRFCNPPEKLK